MTQSSEDGVAGDGVAEDGVAEDGVTSAQPEIARPEIVQTGTMQTGTVETETETIPEAMVASFSSLTTAYCWVITEDLFAGYDGAEPSAVGKYGPPEAVLADVREALGSGRWFRLAGEGEGMGGFAVGRIYDPSGQNDRAPLDEIGEVAWAASVIEYRQGGRWEPC
jgi:hypothetical protein